MVATFFLILDVSTVSPCLMFLYHFIAFGALPNVKAGIKSKITIVQASTKLLSNKLAPESISFFALSYSLVYLLTFALNLSYWSLQLFSLLLTALAFAVLFQFVIASFFIFRK